MRKMGVVLVGASACALGLWVSGHARAGFKTSEEVAVITIPNGNGSRAAVGQIGAARNTLDTVQYIGCTARQNVGGALTVGCSARDALGDTLTCTSSNASLLPIIGAMTADARIGFGADAAGVCTYIFTDNSSKYQPKK